MKLTMAHTTALTASLTPVSPTDTAGTHSHFTHAQTQPHQSTALIRMGKGYHLVALVAAGSPLHSAPLQRSRALATTARRRQALTSVWWTCCGHSRPSHEAHTRPRHWARSAYSVVVAACAKDAPPSCWRCYRAREAGSGATQTRSSLAVLSRRRPARVAAGGRLVGGEQPGGLQSSQQHEATGERTASANTALRKGTNLAFKFI